ncbi:MAG: zinc protease [Planctomycetota bacterium]|jgi:zinc protease
MISLFACAFLAASILPNAKGGEQDSADNLHSYTLPNGMRITLLEDHSLPKVVINTWFAVGSKDEAPGRTGFAHLFEHLMFMGTERVPGNQFDVIMESGGGSNNASTSQDRTNYYSIGPSSLLPTLLWLDADRFEDLAETMTQAKLDSQRAIVRNERRQTGENVPYGRARLMLPELLYPEGHPYRHSVIGSHEDLEAATVEDVKAFFRTNYVPGNASLVVAGDFDRDEVIKLIANTMGAVTVKPVPKHTSASPVAMHSGVRAVTYDDVQLPKLILAWHSPGYMTDGDGAMDVVASILSGGPATRLEKRLVQELGLAQEVVAYQGSAKLGSVFHIEITGVEGADLDEIKNHVFKVLKKLMSPTMKIGRDEELARVQAQMERNLLQAGESIRARADSVNRYIHYWDVTDGFQRDLERWTNLTVDDVRNWANRVLGEPYVELRVLPTDDQEQLGELVILEDGTDSTSAASLDDRPSDFESRAFVPPAPKIHTLSNGFKVVTLERPGTRLFSGTWIVPGGESRVSKEHAGLATLVARMMTQGSRGKDAATWAQAVESIGASITVQADYEQMAVNVSGLASKFEETLEFFTQAALYPNMESSDLERERGLMLGEIARRADNARSVASLASRALLFGTDSYRGRPLDGNLHSLESLGDFSDDMKHKDISSAHWELIWSEKSSFIFVGDFDTELLLKFLESRFGPLDIGAYRKREVDIDASHEEAMNVYFQTFPSIEIRKPQNVSISEEGEPKAAALIEPATGRTVMIDKPGAPQTVVYILRPLAKADGIELAIRTCLNTALGGSFTSRLNTNLREKNGYSYGAGSRISREGDQVLMVASSSVRTDVTGAALQEFKKEFDLLASGNVDADELDKAVKTSRSGVMGQFETTGSISGTFASLISNERPLDAKASELEFLGEVNKLALNAYARNGIYDWSKLQIVLVGDAQLVLPQLEAAGFPVPIRANVEGQIQD